MNRRVVEAIAYGDAYGLPYETRTRDEIMALGGARPHLIEPSVHSDFKDFLGEPIGTWSDDTEHTLIAAEALYDYPSSSNEALKLIAHGLKNALPSAKGWGGTTKKAIARVETEMSFFDLITNGETKGNGCGPLMRALPIAALSLKLTDAEVEELARYNTTITHNNAENITSSLVHNQVLIDLMRGERFDKAYAEDLLAFIAKTESKQGSLPKLSEAYANALNTDDMHESVYKRKRSEAFTTWSVQAVAYRMILDYGDADLLTLLKHTVEVGGDTDSTASIAASLWSILHSEGILPADSGKLAQLPRLAKASEFLCKLVEASR